MSQKEEIMIISISIIGSDASLASNLCITSDVKISIRERNTIVINAYIALSRPVIELSLWYPTYIHPARSAPDFQWLADHRSPLLTYSFRFGNYLETNCFSLFLFIIFSFILYNLILILGHFFLLFLSKYITNCFCFLTVNFLSIDSHQIN